MEKNKKTKLMLIDENEQTLKFLKEMKDQLRL